MKSEHTASEQQEEIRLAAYYLWQERGCPFGAPDTDWFEAEEQLREAQEKARQCQTGFSLQSSVLVQVQVQAPRSSGAKIHPQPLPFEGREGTAGQGSDLEIRRQLRPVSATHRKQHAPSSRQLVCMQHPSKRA